MVKEINEKTFELNITNELLNLSKSFWWYLGKFNFLNFPKSLEEGFLNVFMSEATFFAEGLTQEEENNTLSGGYDVSINFNHPNGFNGRLMFLQFKAGKRKQYSTKIKSNFYRSTAKAKGINSEHALFTFNDAAEGTQHSTLRSLANTEGVNPNSVFYIFPRITEKTDFYKKVGNLLSHSSFVSVLEIDQQAANQTPPITITDGNTHNYRTSYDGFTSEVNYYYFYFYYENKIIAELISELICIQIERCVMYLTKKDTKLTKLFLSQLSKYFSRFVEFQLRDIASNQLVNDNVLSYIKEIDESINLGKEVPEAPNKYTIIIPNEGLKLTFKEKIDLSRITYQIF